MRMWWETHPQALLDPVSVPVLVFECAAGDAKLREVLRLNDDTPDLRQREVDIVVHDLQLHQGFSLSLDGKVQVC